jgi:tRNA-splicing ligase RtcB (3'-phosphate/5'-hydroxy nucleic acid ligase)
MPISEIKGKNVPICLWSPIEEVESSAIDQLRNIAALPWAFKHVAVMPDVHFGVGATVGSVIAMKNAISPAAVGVDIGCGMAALQTNLNAADLPNSLQEILNAIEDKIPLGHGEYHSPIIEEAFRGDKKYKAIKNFLKGFSSLEPKVQDIKEKAYRQIGTLGGGNHFIELCLDTKDSVWLMLHSGSRYIGKTLAEIHINRAKKLIHNQEIPDKSLAVFLSNTPEMKAYRNDLEWAQGYALLNREAMLKLYLKVITKFFPNLSILQTIQCHHNYVSEEIHFGEEVLVTRKGAISARLGEMGIIPGSMGTKSYIVRGLGNEMSFHSASHGSGRRMSRGEAKRRFSVEELQEQTQGVMCKKDSSVLDEIPMAYKDIDKVMENQKDLVEIVHELKQVLCVKG